MHKWKGHAGCAGNMLCRRLETLTASVGLGEVALSRHLSESAVLLQFSVGSGQSLPVVQCWCSCACLCGGNSSPGLLAESVGCGSITKAQPVLEPLTSP